MKKLVFTALAVVIFSGVAVANTADSNKNSKIELKTKLAQEADCYEKAMDAVDAADLPSDVDSHNLYIAVLRSCLKDS